MSTEVKFRRGTTAQHATFTGAVGEVTVNTDKNTLVVHDGVTPGGHEVSGAIADGSITNAKLANMASGTVKGNATGASSAPSDLTAANVRTLINVSDGADVTRSVVESVSAIDAIVDGDGIIVNDASAAAGAKTKFVLWSAIKTALALVFAGITHKSNHATGGSDALTPADIGAPSYIVSTWNPVVTSGSGTITTKTVNRAVYHRVGNVVTIFLDLSITDLGSATGQINVTLPINANSTCAMAGREVAVGGKSLTATSFTSYIGILNYDNTSPLVANGNYVICGSYTVG